MEKIMKIRRFVVSVLIIILIAAIGIGVFMLMRHRQGQKQPQSQLPAQASTTHPVTVPLDISPQTEATKSTTEPITEPTTAPTTEPTPASTTNPTATNPPLTNPPATAPPVTESPTTEEKECSPWCLFGKFTTILEPTATSTGLQVAYCKNCGKEFLDEIPRLISPEKLENIDPRITITKNVADCTVAYDYKNLGVWDLRSWGGAPIMVITEDDCLEITYFKQDGSEVVYLLKPVEDAKVWISIREDGSYRYHIFDGFENVDGSGG